MKKHLKTIFCLLLTGAMMCSMAACGKGQTGGNESGQSKEENTIKDVRVWLPPYGTEDSLDKAVWQKTFDEFTEETGGKVECQIIGWEAYPDKYLSGVNSGNGPDLGYMYADMVLEFINTNGIEDVGPYLTDADRDNFLYLEQGFIQGKQYGLPIIVGNPRVILYNKTLLEEAGVQPPKTRDEFVEACKKLTIDKDGDGEIDQWGYAQGWGDKAYGCMQEIFTPFLLSAGGQLFSDDGTKAEFGNEAGVETAQFLWDLVYTHKVMPENCTGMTGPDVGDMFKASKVAFVSSATSSASTIDTVDWGYILGLEVNGQEAKTMMVADYLVLMSAARNKELTVELMRKMLSGESMERFHTELTPFPPVAKDEEYHDNPVFQDLYENHSHQLIAEKPVKNSFKINDYLYKNMQMVMMNELSPEEGIKGAADFANELLAE